MAVHAQRKSLDSLNGQERVEWRDGSADVSEQLNASLDDVGAGTKCRPVGKAVVAGIGLGELWELVVRREVKAAAVNNCSNDCSAMAANELGCRVHHDVCAVR